MSKYSAIADPVLMMGVDALEKLLDDEPSQPTHFRCPKCQTVFPVSELDYLPEIKYDTSYETGMTLFGAGIKRTIKRTIIKHPVCRNCLKKEKERRKKSLLKIACLIALIIFSICIISHLK